MFVSSSILIVLVICNNSKMEAYWTCTLSNA